jgi:methylglutaconyl-CoA hydratase
MTELVHLDVAAGVATITLDSPDNRNALSAQLRRELQAHLDAVVEDTAVRVIVLAHTGRVFCSGMDLKEARGAGAQDQGVTELPRIIERIWTSPKPVVAKVAGPARAGGLGLVAAADIAVAAEDATFAVNEVRLGLVPAVISVVTLPRLLPRAAHEFFLTGSAVPGPELDGEVDRYVQMLRLGAPAALAAAKELLRRERSRGLGAQFAEMLELSARFFAGEEGQEGVRAFAEKRTPSWVDVS